MAARGPHHRARLRKRMGVFRVDIEICRPGRQPRWVSVPQVLVDSGAEMSCLPEHAALQELRRVLKPTGRLLVGEVAFDPDFVTFGSLQERAGRAGFVFERRMGGSLSYLARFRPA